MDEYKEALKELERTRTNFNEVTGHFKRVAELEMLAAEERVMAIIRERRTRYEENN